MGVFLQIEGLRKECEMPKEEIMAILEKLMKHGISSPYNRTYNRAILDVAEAICKDENPPEVRKR